MKGSGRRAAGGDQGANGTPATDEDGSGTAPDATGSALPDEDPGSSVSEAPADGARRELEEQRDKYLRLAAEYDNFRRRSAKERQEAGARGQAELVKQLVDALDDLSRFAHVDPASTDTTTIVQGVDMVEKKMHKALQAAGLQVLNPVDEPFDPALHEAVTTEPAASADEDHLVSRVFQAGYLFQGQLLRPARVVVRQWNG